MNWRFWQRSKKVTIPVVRLTGVIGAGSALRPGLSLNGVAGALEKAFKAKAPAVALVINSPGGSPVQSSLIFKRIRALAGEHDKTVLVFVEDVAASGGYYIAVAGDEIYADASSIVGSIGVISAAFGFVDLIEKIGVERRVYTTGEDKGMLDPFTPERERDVAILRAVQDDVLDAFVDVVRSRRGDKLADEPDLFTGRFWSGSAGAKIGLVDGVSDIHTELKERFGDSVRLRPIPLGRRTPFRGLFGSGLALSVENLLGALWSESHWARFRL